MAARAVRGASVLRVRELSVAFETGTEDVAAVDGVSFELAAGQVLAIIGESGSGKSATLQAVAGLLPTNARVGGDIRLAGRDVNLAAHGAARHGIAGREIGMIFQNPAASLNPVLTVGAHVEEVVRAHRGLRGRACREASLALLERVGIGDVARRARAYPHELSGGLKQRVAIAAALAGAPRLLLADEPTTALDATVQAQILDLLLSLVDTDALALVFVTHDLAVAGAIADRLALMRAGRIVESGTAHRVMHEPTHAYAVSLVSSSLGLRGADARALGATSPVVPERDTAAGGSLALRGVKRCFGARPPRAIALDGVDLEVRAGEIVALVGESGSGKTTLARIAVGLDRAERGAVTLDGRTLPSDGRFDRATRARIQMVFQDPLASFNPRRTVLASIVLAVRLTGGARWREACARATELLESVGLSPALGSRKPHTLSGGQLQRAAIARALASDPDYLVCDEAVASLDASVRARVLELLSSLRESRGLGVLFVSHDLGVVSHIADRVAVLYLGRVVEEGPVRAVLEAPWHPYTRGLRLAVPSGEVRWRERERAGQSLGEPGSPFAIPSGCRFRPRCALRRERCEWIDPALSRPPGEEGDRRVACVLFDDEEWSEHL